MLRLRITIVVILFLLTINIIQTQDETEPKFSVIVELNTTYTPESNLPNAFAIQSQRMVIHTAQENVLRTLNLEEQANITRYEVLPYLAMEIDSTGLAHLKSNANVSAIYPNKQYELLGTPADLSNALQGSPAAWASGYDGTGQVVAVLDAGFDFKHPALAGKAVEEACFTLTLTVEGATTTCPNGQDSQVGPGASFPSGFPSVQQPPNHGQHVAGILAGNDGIAGGFRGSAPGAKLIGVNVFARLNTPDQTIAFDSDLIKAIEWLYNSRKKFNLVAVNMSLGGGAYPTEAHCNRYNVPIRNAIKLLTNAGIAVIAASGNKGYVDKMVAPACISEVISVGAVEVAGTNTGLVDDDVPSFSNSAYFLDLLAPGDLIYSSVFNDNYDYKQGTSMAAPHVSGAWAIISQAFPYATLDEKLAALKTTGVQVTDLGSGVTTPRVQVNAALGIKIDPSVPLFPLNELVWEEVLFEWTHSPFASSYRLVISQNNGEIFNQMVKPICIFDICSYRPNVTLEDGIGYSWYVSAISPLGPETVSVKSSFLFSKGKVIISEVVASLNVDIDSLTDTVAPVRPTFKWTHRQTANTTTVPGLWYNLEITQDVDQISLWYPVQQICEGLRCEVTPSRDEFLIGLNNGRTTWRVRYWTPLSGIGGWSESRAVGIVLERPVTPQNVVVDGRTGRPIITWEHDPNATWFNVWVGKPGFKQIHSQWYEKTDVICGGLTCTLVPDAHPFETGDYSVWIQAWGPVGFSQGGGFEDWAGPFDFNVNNPAPDAVTGLIKTDTNSGRPTFSWSSVDHATWYQIQIRDLVNNTVVAEWHSAYDLGCNGGTLCKIVPQAVLTQDKSYDWQVQAWGPGGFNRNDRDYFTIDPTPPFTVNATNPVPPILLTPTGDKHQRKPTFSWEAQDDASWYNVQVVEIGASGPLVDSWFPAEDLGCNLNTICSTQINTWLANGGYQWQVRAYTPVDVGPFSTKTLFSVSNSP